MSVSQMRYTLDMTLHRPYILYANLVTATVVTALLKSLQMRRKISIVYMHEQLLVVISSHL